MKKLIAFIVAFTMMLSVIGVSQISVGADYTTMRDITAFDLVAEMNTGINIGNSFDAAWGVGQDETAWGNPKITLDLIKAYKEAGFNTIRLPVTWRGNIDANGIPYSNWLKRIQEVVDWILNEDMYCIVNTHHDGDWLHTSDEGLPERKIKFRNLWAAIANRFKNYGDHLLFEGYNEIQKKEGNWSSPSTTDLENLNALSQVFVDAVRETGGNNSNRILIISTYGAMDITYGLVLPEDDVENKLAVEFHDYYPSNFCFSGTQTTWGSSSDNETVENYCKNFYNAFVSKKIPVILGEFGAVNKNNYEARTAYAEKVAVACKNYGIKPIWWDNGILTGTTDSFCLINRVTYKNEYPNIVSALVDNSVSVKAPDYPTLSPVSTTTRATKATTTVTTTTTTTTIPTTAPAVDYVNSVSLEFNSINSVDVRWDVASDADFYKIYRKVNNGAFEYYDTSYSNIMTDRGLLKGKTYSYCVYACKEYAGNIYMSKASPVVKATTLAAKMSKVTKKAYKTAVLLKYKSVVGADGYEIKYSTKKNLKGAKKKTVKTLQYKIKNLKKNKKYYFSVRAFKVINGKKVYTTAKKINTKLKK